MSVVAHMKELVGARMLEWVSWRVVSKI